MPTNTSQEGIWDVAFFQGTAVISTTTFMKTHFINKREYLKTEVEMEVILRQRQKKTRDA